MAEISKATIGQTVKKIFEKNKATTLITGAAAGVVAFMSLKSYFSKPKRTEEEKLKIDRQNALGKGKAEVNRDFFMKMKMLLKITVPGLASKEALLLLIQAGFLFARTLLSIYVARLDGFIVKGLVSANREKFLSGIVFWLLIAFPATYVNSMIKYMETKIAIFFRSRLTKFLHEKYLDGTTYYAISNLDSRLDNADQLITNDVSKFCNAVSELYSNLAKPILDVILFAAQLASTVGLAGPGMMTLFYILTGYFLRIVTPPFGKLAAQDAKLEGDFRFAHSRIITNAEEIAFYNGQHAEKKIVNRLFDQLFHHKILTQKKKIWHGMIEGMIIKYWASVQGLFICAIPVFFSDWFGRFGVAGSGEDLSSRTEDYIRNRRYLINLADAIGRILYSYKEVTELAGYTQRVGSMVSVFDDVQHHRYEKNISEENRKRIKDFTKGDVTISDSDIEVKGVPIVTPNGDVLVDNMDFEIKHGMHMLVTGPNGCGKSSLFRVIGGLWPTMNGHLKKPRTENLFYIPQRPYLCIGTLRDQLIYPDTIQNMKDKGLTDEKLETYLNEARLLPILAREGGWNVVKDWKDVLSGGEKQRMAMARLFYHHPQYAILDECTSQVSVDVEDHMYKYAKSLDISLLTISHRQSLWKHHDFVLQFDGHGGFEIVSLKGDKDHRMSLEQKKSDLKNQILDFPELKKKYLELCETLGDKPDIKFKNLIK